ncbi:PREDICTED: putative two-component response regulator ARR20 [Camelina sativa]|uniref:Two-component response regulator ARR20 n=1 Tax=Camelina sativa TaxID=90675 RepID=A0ABM0WNQ8_CAMSA|nr:PREDICTED: putative two-component response regulator ARR20 [Camelina sativa]
MSVSANILDENSRNLRKEVLACDDEIESPINDDDEEFPTTSIRVLLVDADSNSLLLMTNLMAQYSYQVTKYDNGEEAMAFLMKSKHEIDLVIWDFHMPDINGLDALNTIGKEMDLPVVIMSHDHKKETVMASTKNGACDFLVEPVSKEVVAVVWQHVYRKSISKSGLDKPGESCTVESDSDEYEGLLGQDNLHQSHGEGSKNTCDQKEDVSSAMKPRMKWSAELHQKFEAAVEKIGSIEKAYPKQILKCMQEDMNVQGLTRNNVASHLQKYRQSSNKKTSTPQETQEDHFDWCNTGQDPPDFAASNPPLSSTRAPYFMNDIQAAAMPRTSYFTTDQAAPPIQCLSNGYNLPMNNKNTYFMANHVTYIDQFQQPLQQQQYQYPCLNLPSMLTKQESGHVSSAMENSDTLIYSSSFPNFDHDDYFPPAEFNNNNNPDQFPPFGLNNNRDHQFPPAGMNSNHDQFPPAGLNNNNRDQFPPSGLNNNNRDQFPLAGMNNNTRDQFPPSGLNNTRDQFPLAGFNNNFDQTGRN